MAPRKKLFVSALVLSALVSSLAVVQATAATRDDKRDQVRSDLKNAATAEESYFTRDGIRYTRVLNKLKAEGFEPSPNVRILIARADGQGYCLEGQHDAMGETWHYSSDVGTPERGRC